MSFGNSGDSKTIVAFDEELGLWVVQTQTGQEVGRADTKKNAMGIAAQDMIDHDVPTAIIYKRDGSRQGTMTQREMVEDYG